MPDEPRRLLICQIAFESLAGSEIVVLELVEWFTARGWTVDVSTTLFGEPIESEVAGLIAAGRLRILLPADVVAARAEQYDLIWVHHSFLPAAIIAQLEHGPISTPMIWHHLSSFQSIGLPLLYEAEDALASIITSMAPVARDRVSAFGFAQHRLELFDNPAPDAFLEVERPAPAERLESVLVVSNHPPAELAAAAELLEAGGVRVSIAGLTGQYGRVLPSSLDGHDAVVTIGKTTQYALVMGVPVYSYDHFGGGGWITEQNLEREHYGNFAGRIERRVLTGEQIAAELSGGYAGARAFAQAYRPTACRRWSLTRQLEALLADERCRPRPRTMSSEQVRRSALLCAERDELWGVVRHAQADIAELLAELRAVGLAGG